MSSPKAKQKSVKKSSASEVSRKKLDDGGEMIVFHVEQTKKNTQNIIQQLRDQNIKFRLLNSHLPGQIVGYIQYA